MQKAVLVRKDKKQHDREEFFAGYDTSEPLCIKWSSFDFAWLISEELYNSLMRYLAIQKINRERYSYQLQAFDNARNW